MLSIYYRIYFAELFILSHPFVSNSCAVTYKAIGRSVLRRILQLFSIFSLLNGRLSSHDISSLKVHVPRHPKNVYYIATPFPHNASLVSRNLAARFQRSLATQFTLSPAPGCNINFTLQCQLQGFHTHFNLLVFGVVHFIASIHFNSVVTYKAIGRSVLRRILQLFSIFSFLNGRLSSHDISSLKVHFPRHSKNVYYIATPFPHNASLASRNLADSFQRSLATQFTRLPPLDVT